MLDIQSLAKTYPGGVTALHDITLHIPRGMFGLLGPNGSGKTTLMRILAGLLEPTGGRVRFNGDDVTEHPERIWPQLGYLPQYFGFHPGLTGTAMLMHMLRLKGVEHAGSLEALCAELLARVNLTHAASRPVKTYSGGMRQRLGIAQAIAGAPALLIVDEPTAGLDPEERTRLYQLLAELAESCTVLLSTHIVDDVAVLCPRMAIIRNGRLLANTTPHEARAAIDGTMYEGEVGRHEVPALATRFEVTQSFLVEGRQRVRVHAPTHAVPDHFTPVAPTLEDAYMLLTQRDARERPLVAAQRSVA
ncbi:MAG: ATP-binding cassette domain-containing protein [Gemmatimonadetes bacterium]|nr:ATP-binding cassette domain-containing protein [Gemmatimonadota bacterium]